MSVTIYKFSQKERDALPEGIESISAFLGGKGAGVRMMAELGLPVPPGFTIPTSDCLKYLSNQKKKDVFLEGMIAPLNSGMTWLTDQFGYTPLVSVRSGARVSMPGMMDTILNVGLTDVTVLEWVERIGGWAAWDSYRRLIQMFGSVALGVASEEFESYMSIVKGQVGITSDTELHIEDLQLLVMGYKQIIKRETGMDFPQTLETQLYYTVQAVFESWDNDRAISYRKMNNYPETWGTAVNIQSMVFGNMNNLSGSGVLFTRDPSTGEDSIVGEFLPNAQGEDVVAGIRTPLPLSDMDKVFGTGAILNDLMVMVSNLETNYRDMQDVEFTIQNGEIFILQTRNGKRSSRAAFKIAYDLFSDGIITREEMISRVSYKELKILKRAVIDPSFNTAPDITGIPAGGSVVSGIAVFYVAQALEAKVPCILVKEETTPDDIEGMNASVGILTATGGLTSHAAVVARGMNKTCVVGCTGMKVEHNKAFYENGVFSHGMTITLDGNTGRVWVSTPVPIIAGELSEEAENLIEHVMQIEDPIVIYNSQVGPADTRLWFHTYPYDMDGTYTKMREDIKKVIATSVEVIIDLTTPSPAVISETDLELLSMFSEMAPTSAYIVAKRDVILKGLTPLEHSKITVVMPESDLNTEHGFQGSKIKFVKPASTMKDIMKGGYAHVSSHTIHSLFGDQDTYNDFLDVMSSAGKKLNMLPLPVTKQAYLRRHLS